MKKFVAVIIFIFFWSNISFSDIFIKDCKTIYPAGYYEFNPDKEFIDTSDNKKEYYISYDDGKIYYTNVSSNLTLKIFEKAQEEGLTTPTLSKVTNYEYDIQFIDENEVIGIRIEEYAEPKFNHYEEITIDLNSFRVSRRVFADTSGGKQMIKTAKSLLKGYPLSEICKNDENFKKNQVASGTAFFISRNGHLITNNHVVEGCELSKINFKNKNYDAKLLATDKTLDLALLKADIKSSTFFSFSKDGANKLNKIYVAGFPLGKGLSDDLKISSGIVSALKGFNDNSNEIQIDAPINPGNSGGPIINENGNLVAIAVSGLAKDQTEGINFGIKSSAAETFLKANNINPKKSMYSRIKENDELLEILEEGTVYTYCD